MLETFKPILLALFLVFFGTKNGRSLIISSLRNSLHYVPRPIRRFVISNSTLIPLRLSRSLMYIATSPFGNQKKWVHKIKKDTWEGNWITPNLKNVKEAETTALDKDLIILYIHGGGFSMGYSAMYISTFQFIINNLLKEYKIRSSILSVEYSLSPENVWPKACHESVDAYRYLIHTLGINPHKVILIGDSAGGNLVATTLLTLKNQRSDERLHDLPPLSLPAGAALLSPWVDLTPNLASFKVAQPHLDSLSSNQLAKYTSNYIPNYDYLDNESKQAMLQNPLISPLYGNFTGVCPLFIAYGDNEILKTSIEAFISNLKKDVHSIAIFKGVNANHVWLVDSLMASSKQVFEEDCKVLISWIALTSKTGC